MNLRLRTVDSPDEALALEPQLQKAAEESSRSFRAEPIAPGFARAFAERGLGAAETVLVVAESPERPREPVGICASVPWTEPYGGPRTALLVALRVEPAFRHRGVARALVREARKALAARGVTAFAARAGHNDDALISMGERWGFVRAFEFLLGE